MKAWVENGCLASLLCLLSASAGAHPAPRSSTARPLFARDSEVFALQNQSGDSPRFRVLDDSTAEKALAIAIAAALNAQPETKKKVPVRDHLELRFETLTLAPAEGDPDRLTIRMRVSGNEVVFPETIEKSRFLAGETVEARFPDEARPVSVFSVETGGRLRFRLDPRKKELAIEDAFGHLRFASSWAGKGEETVRFAGRGVRR